MKVDVRNNNVEKALRILKKKLQQDGIFNELRNREHFISKGEKGRKAKAAAKRRQEKAIQKRLEEFGF
jgi:small subunit ribosomal protein S21|tara:strand:+ start:232 stop:435 length:204 start_codon:yes stop_codon:yes gene_type:complete